MNSKKRSSIIKSFFFIVLRYLSLVFKFVWFLPRNFLILLIRIYQKTLSPDHSWMKIFFEYGYCKFYPTCSEYGVQALKKHGAICGSLKTIGRILRCNPCGKGGIDKV